MKIFALLASLIFVASAFGQEKPYQPLTGDCVHNYGTECDAPKPVKKVKNPLAAKYPHPYIETGLSLNGSSESTTSEVVQAGADVEEKHFVSDSFAFYNTKHKDAPGIAPNSRGRQRAFGGTAFYKQGPWQYGVGAEFSQFAITEYTKQSVFGLAGVGRDWSDLTRVQIMYLKAFNERTQYPTKAGCACTNDVNGVRFQMWIPNPATSHHWFFIINFQPIWFHTTVVDPNDPVLTKIDKSQHSVDSTLKFDIRYRF